jgi:chemosensory pili system protein ChpA (sensor histidine kinase/response regulator)
MSQDEMRREDSVPTLETVDVEVDSVDETKSIVSAEVNESTVPEPLNVGDSPIVADGSVERTVDMIGSDVARAATDDAVDPRSAVALEDSLPESMHPDVTVDDPARIDPELTAVFSEEADDHFRQINESLVALRSHPSDRTLMQTIRRSAHTLKGAAGAVGLKGFSKLAHRLEDLLDRIYARSEAVDESRLDLIQRTIDVLHDSAFSPPDRDGIASAHSRLFHQFDRTVGTVDLRSATPIEPEVKPIASVGPKINDVKPNVAGDKATAESTLRVPLRRVERLSASVGDLTVHRAALKRRVDELERIADEFKLSVERFQSLSREFQIKLESSSGESRRERGADSVKSSLRRNAGVSKGSDGFDELEFDRYTDLHLLVRSLAEATGDAATLSGEIESLTRELEASAVREQRIASDLQKELLRVRTLPFERARGRLSRALRIACDRSGKQATLEFRGGEIELDKTVLDEIVEPLAHLVRNAVDHGLESAERRSAAGKSAVGVVTVAAESLGSEVVFVVSDDGAGVDQLKLRRIAIERGYLSEGESNDADEATMLGLIFKPGFSTADAVTEISGRGVGMDVVQQAVRELGGSISVRTVAGSGATIRIRLPMVMSTTRAVFVDVGTFKFAVGFQDVVRIESIPAEQAGEAARSKKLSIGDRRYSFFRAAELFGLPVRPDWDADAEHRVVIVKTELGDAALEVDDVTFAREIAVRPADPLLRNVRGMVGTTMLGDGTPIPFMSSAELLRSDGDDLRVEVGEPSIRVRTIERTRTVMIVDDSVSVRKVSSNLMSRSGWSVLTAKDGVDAIEVLQRCDRQPDLFLLDIEMPRMDGYELTESLRSSSAHTSTPIIMITSRAGDKHRNRAFELGVDRYLVKPFDEQALLAAADELTAIATATA